MFSSGAFGRVEGCDIRGCSRGDGVVLGTAGTSPLICRNTIRNCKWGVGIASSVDPSWSLGEGNVFVNCTEEDVVYERIPPPLPPPGPPPPA